MVGNKCQTESLAIFNLPGVGVVELRKGTISWHSLREAQSHSVCGIIIMTRV